MHTGVGETDPRTPMGPADWAPFGSAGGGDRTKSRSRRSTRAVYPASELSGEITLLLLLVWFYSVLALERELSVFWLTNESNRTEPPLRCTWASFYTLKGSPTGGNAEKGTNVKSEVVGTVTCTVHPT